MNDKFDFKYTAPTEEERKEAESYRREYSGVKTPQDALSEMRELDKRVKRPALIFAYLFGIAGILLLGTGMCFVTESLKGGLVLGITVGCVGIAMMIANHFIYKAILNARKKKFAAKILELSESVLGKRNG